MSDTNEEERENTSEQMLIDMSNQMKEKFDKNEKEMESLRKEKIKNEMEMISWYGLITALDGLLADSPCPHEIQTMSEILSARADKWLNKKLGGKEEEITIFSGINNLNIQIIDNNDINEI